MQQMIFFGCSDKHCCWDTHLSCTHVKVSWNSITLVHSHKTCVQKPCSLLMLLMGCGPQIWTGQNAPCFQARSIWLVNYCWTWCFLKSMEQANFFQVTDFLQLFFSNWLWLLPKQQSCIHKQCAMCGLTNRHVRFSIQSTKNDSLYLSPNPGAKLNMVVWTYKEEHSNCFSFCLRHTKIAMSSN